MNTEADPKQYMNTSGQTLILAEFHQREDRRKLMIVVRERECVWAMDVSLHA